MKKLLFLCFFVWLSTNIFAQKTLTQEQHEVLPISVKQQIEDVSSYSSNNWGKEIGVAVNESLTAIEQTAINIADSKIGDVAVFLVIWKFCMRDILRIVFSIAIICFGIWGYNKFWKNHIKTNGLKNDGDYVFMIMYPLIIIGIAAMAMFA